jgi:hypothetical protein
MFSYHYKLFEVSKQVNAKDGTCASGNSFSYRSVRSCGWLELVIYRISTSILPSF